MEVQDVRVAIVNGVANDIPLTDIYLSLRDFVGKRGFYKIVLSLIEAGDMPNVMICYCGIDCTHCKTFLATINDDDALRELVQGYYAEIGHAMELEEIHCLGCRSDEMLPGCADCPYMKCGKEVGLKRCDECIVYPCESLNWYIENYVKPGVGKFIVP